MTPTDAGQQLHEHLVARIEAELAAIDRDQRADVYVVGLLLSFADEELAPPRLDLGWNTERHAAQESAGTTGADALDARWNYGRWVADGTRIDDHTVRELAARAYDACGLGAPQPDALSDEGVDRGIAMQVAAARFIGELARSLHSHGVLERALEHDVLVLCYTGSDSDPWTRLTLDANPPHLHGTFKDFHDAEGVHDESF